MTSSSNHLPAKSGLRSRLLAIPPYVLDLWIEQWRKTKAKGDVLVVRFADDFVVGFQHRKESEQFLDELRERLAKFGLKLHPEKTRLIEFGRFYIMNTAWRNSLREIGCSIKNC